nr:DUF3268 family zinc-finger domain-containing protein [Actinomycetota bacterium]
VAPRWGQGEAMSEPMIRCPVCGGISPASWQYGFGDDQVYVCRECGSSVRADLVEAERRAGGTSAGPTD